MYDFHPFFAAFPVVLVITTFLIVCARYSPWVNKCSLDSKMIDAVITINITLGAFSAVCAFLSGYYAAGYENLTPESPFSQDIAFHHTIARISMFLALLTTAFRIIWSIATHGKKIWHILFILCLIFTTLLVAYTGYLGGDLVFEHGIGVAS